MLAMNIINYHHPQTLYNNNIVMSMYPLPHGLSDQGLVLVLRLHQISVHVLYQISQLALAPV